MNKLAHGLLTVAFAAACACLWVLATLVLNTAARMVDSHPIPAFARLCFSFRWLLLVLPLLAVAHCLLVCIRKSDGQRSWVAFFATTMYALVLLSFPVAITGWLMLIGFFNLVANR